MVIRKLGTRRCFPDNDIIIEHLYVKDFLITFLMELQLNKQVCFGIIGNNKVKPEKFFYLRFTPYFKCGKVKVHCAVTVM